MAGDEQRGKGYEDRPLYPIGVAAELLGVTDQTLRLYESQGLIKPARRNRERYYSPNDLKWLECLRHLIHVDKVSIAGIKRLLDFAPCWEIANCPPDEMSQCTASLKYAKPCWELTRRLCPQRTLRCEDCSVYQGAGEEQVSRRLRRSR